MALKGAGKRIVVSDEGRLGLEWIVRAVRCEVWMVERASVRGSCCVRRRG